MPTKHRYQQWTISKGWDVHRPVWLFHRTSRQLDPQTKVVYIQMVTRLQRDMLLLLMAITVPLSIFFGIQLVHNIWVEHAMPPVVFVIHTANATLIVLLAICFLYRRRITAAWVSVLSLSFISTLVQIWLLRQPGLMLFVLLALVGPAIVIPLRVTALLVGGFVAAVFLIVRFTFLTTAPDLTSIVPLFVTIMLGFGCIGIIIRRFIWQFAQNTVEIEQAAIQRGALEQQMRGLRHQVVRIASLEHDLRQPLRVVQGYLSTLALESRSPVRDDLIPPAQAAIQRAERLINNLLDQTRVEANEHEAPPVAIDPTPVFTSIEQSASGLASYYTDPPVPIHFCIRHPLPEICIDRDQLERAVLNLLDNALAYSPPDGTIEVRAWGTDEMLYIEVQDMGPGIPVNVIEALVDDVPATHQPKSRLGLGLRQVNSTVQTHGGNLTFMSAGAGTIVRITIPRKGI